MANSTIPLAQAPLISWNRNALTQLDALSPEAVGLSLAQFSDWTAKFTAFETLFNQCNEPTTRTPARVFQKNEAKKALLDVARLYVRYIQGFPGTTNDMRRDLQITVRDVEPSPIGRPETAPELSVVSVSGRVLDLRLREPGATRRGKPAGVRGAWLYTFVGNEAPTDFAQMKFEGATTRTDPQVVVDADVPAGSKVFVSACWVNPTDQPGPACMPVATWTNGGSMQVKAAA